MKVSSMVPVFMRFSNKMYRNNNKVTSRLLENAKRTATITSFFTVNSKEHKDWSKHMIMLIRDRAVLRKMKAHQ